MFFELFTERQRLSHQIGATLASRLVQPFDMGGFAGIFSDLMPPFRRQNVGVTRPEIAGRHGTFALVRRQRLPHHSTRRIRAVAKGDPDDPTGLTFQREPNPDFFGVRADI